MSSIPSFRNCPAGDTSHVAHNERDSSFRTRSSLPYQGSRPAVNVTRDTWLSQAYTPRTVRESPVRSEESPEHRSTTSYQGSLSQGSRMRKGCSHSVQNVPASRHRGACPVDIDAIMQGYENMRLNDPVEDKCIPVYKDNDTFFPAPKVTFFIDRPRNIICSICKETRLQMKSSLEPTNEDDTMILPCSHAFCFGCLDSWMKTSMTCPLCRSELVRHCGHRVEPRVIAQDTIMSLPPTISEGGKIAPTCWDCRQQGQSKKLRQLEKQFRRFRELLTRCTHDQAEDFEGGRQITMKAQAAFDKARKEFETFLKSTTYANSSFLHTFW